MQDLSAVQIPAGKYKQAYVIGSPENTEVLAGILLMQTQRIGNPVQAKNLLSGNAVRANECVIGVRRSRELELVQALWRDKSKRGTNFYEIDVDRIGGDPARKELEEAKRRAALEQQREREGPIRVCLLVGLSGDYEIGTPYLYAAGLVESALDAADQVVACDDHTEDGTAEWLSTKEASDPRLSVITHTEPLGLTTALNSAASLARTVWPPGPMYYIGAVLSHVPDDWKEKVLAVIAEKEFDSVAVVMPAFGGPTLIRSDLWTPLTEDERSEKSPADRQLDAILAQHKPRGLEMHVS